MADLVLQKATEMLKAASDAHHTYEKDELEGKRDEQWTAWYADNLITNGLGSLIGKELDADELAAFLEESSRQLQGSGSKETWQDYTATRFLETFE